MSTRVMGVLVLFGCCCIVRAAADAEFPFSKYIPKDKYHELGLPDLPGGKPLKVGVREDIEKDKDFAYIDDTSVAHVYIGKGSAARREDLIQEDIFSDMLSVLSRVEERTIESDTGTWKHTDVARTAGLYGYQPMSVSPLDCFQEGAYNLPPSHSDALFGAWVDFDDYYGDDYYEDDYYSDRSLSETLTGILQWFLPDEFSNAGLEVIVTPYNFCPFARLLQVYGFDANETTFGACRPFITNPQEHPLIPGGNAQYIALHNSYYYLTFSYCNIALGSPFLWEGADQVINPSYNATFAALPGSSSLTIDGIHEDAPERAAYVDGLGRDMQKRLVDKVVGLDSHLWLDYGDDALNVEAALGGKCAMWDGGPQGLDIFPYHPTDFIFGDALSTGNGPFSLAVAQFTWHPKALLEEVTSNESNPHYSPDWAMEHMEKTLEMRKVALDEAMTAVSEVDGSDAFDGFTACPETEGRRRRLRGKRRRLNFFGDVDGSGDDSGDDSDEVGASTSTCAVKLRVLIALE